VSIPSVPSDWTPPIAKAEKGKPMFETVDNNPGEWPQFTYRPKFQKTGPKNYAHHLLPTGAQPVPADPQGKWVVGDWEFHYKKWKSDEASPAAHKSRSGATSTNPFPDNNKTMSYWKKWN
jgi:hypothetical protein